MDDRRLERALRSGPIDEPSVEHSIARLIAVEREASPGTPILDRRVRGTGVRLRSASGPGIWQLTGTVAAILAILVAGWWFRPTGPTASQAPGGLLSRLQAAGTVQIAVTNGPPQVPAAGGAYAGFDIEVAEALGERLGLRADVAPTAAADIIDRATDWSMALPSRAVPTDPAVSVSRPYYAWPAWLVVAGSSDVTDPAELVGMPICIVPGTAGADWLAGRDVAGSEVALGPPADVTQVERPSDEDCFEAIEQGDAGAAVTAALLDDELAARGVRAVTDSPLLLEHRAVIVRGSGSDVATLLVAVDAALAELRASGRLADLSRASFGGRDLIDGP